MKNRKFGIPRLIDLVRRTPTQIQVCLTSVISLIVLWPIIPSAFSADDTYDSFVPYQLRYSQQSTWQFITSVTNSWKINQGRFFPGAIALGTYAHYFFPERAPYKVLQLFVALVALALFYFLVRLLTNTSTAFLAVLLVLCSTQIHVQYDAVLQFSLQQPSLMIMLLSSMICFLVGIRKSNWYLLVLSAFLYLMSMLTYETTVLLWPLYPLLLIHESPKKWKLRLLSTTVAPTLVVLNLLYLRSQVTATAPGYTSNFALTPLVKTFAKQAFASLPMSYAEVRTPTFMLDFPHHLQFGVWFWWIAVVSTALLITLTLRGLEVPKLRVRLVLIGMGLVLWLMPALVVAQTVRWQGEIVLGNGYITIYQGYFGFSLVAVGLLLEVVARLQGRSRVLVKTIFGLVALLVIVSISSVVTNNRRAVAQYDAGSLWPREHFQRAISVGVFDSVPNESVVFTLQGEWWFNAPFVNWYGGPHLKSLISGRDEVVFPACMSELDTCQSRFGIQYSFFTYGRFLNEPRVTIVGSVVRMTGTNGGIKGIRINSVSAYIDYPTRSQSTQESEVRCKSWLASRVSAVGAPVATSSIQVKKATTSACLAKLPTEVSFNPQIFTP
jgi:hypothetical protein